MRSAAREIWLFLQQLGTDVKRWLRRWALSSLTRLTVTVCAALTLVGLLGWGLRATRHHPQKSLSIEQVQGQQNPAENSEAAAPVGAVTTGAATTAAIPSPDTVQVQTDNAVNDPAAVDAALTFVEAWSSTAQPKTAWLDTLLPLVTDAEYGRLETTDPQNVPVTEAVGAGARVVRHVQDTTTVAVPTLGLGLPLYVNVIGGLVDSVSDVETGR